MLEGETLSCVLECRGVGCVENNVPAAARFDVSVDRIGLDGIG